MKNFKDFFKLHKKEELIVSKKEIEDQIKEEDLKLKGKKRDYDAEPSWYHYIIVLVVFFSAFAIIYYSFEYFDVKENNDKFLFKTFDYPYVVGNMTYNIKFNYPIEILTESDFVIEPSKLDMLNTINFTRVYFLYNGTDNGQVATTAIKVRNFLKYVYNVNFAELSYYYNETNCSNSDLMSKVMIFDINSTRNGVFYDNTNGCVTFETTSGKDIVLLGDKFIYEMIK